MLYSGLIAGFTDQEVFHSNWERGIQVSANLPASFINVLVNLHNQATLQKITFLGIVRGKF